MSIFDSTYGLTERELALHTTSFDEQPLSDKSLSRFRMRCYNYEQTHGVDLYHDCVTGLAEASARMMGIDKRIRRMDSLMIEANIRRLSRMELIYTCISKLVSYLHKAGRDDLIGHMAHYYDPNDFNQVIYHCSDIDAEARFSVLLSQTEDKGRWRNGLRDASKSLRSGCHIPGKSREETSRLCRQCRRKHRKERIDRHGLPVRYKQQKRQRIPERAPGADR